MKPSDLSEFFSLLGKAKKEKEEEFDNLLKEADINLDDLTSSLVSGIKEAKEDQKKQKKNEEKLIEQLDSIIDVIENPKEVKDITEPAVTVGVPEDFDVSKLEEEDALDVQDWNDGKDVKFTEVDAIDIIKPEPIKTPEISDTVAQAIKFIEETNIKEEIENSDDTNLDKLKTEIKQVRDILYKVLAHGPGSGEVNLLKLDDVDEDSAKVDGKVLQYDASSGKFVGATSSGGIGTESSVNTSGIITATKFVGDGSGLTGITASGSGVVVQDEGSNIGTAATINFIGSNVNAALSGGIANITITSGVTTANVRTGILDVAGIATFRNDTLIGSGVTLSPDGDVFTTGVTTSNSFVGDLTGDVTGTASNATQLNSQAASYYLDYDNFSNTPTIPSNNNQLTNGAGYITTSFTSYNQLSDTPTIPSNNNQLTNGAGYITTSFTNTNQLTNGAGFITASDDITGNAATSTKLATARTIAGVSFDGSANISLNNNAITNGAGYITTSFTNTNQLTNGAGFITASDDITGNAATSTKLATARTIAGVSFDGSANISLNNNAITNGAGYITGSALNASNLSSGTIPDSRFPSILPAIDGSALTGIAVTDNIRTNTNATFLQNVNVSGTTTATTFIGNLTGNVTGNTSGSSGSCTGNAATATALANARTIAGVSFDGSANISLNNNAITNGAGFITASDDITGNAATATTLETARNIGGVSFNGSSNIDLPGVNSSGNQDTTGNAATATALETARNIGGVSFDGSANIDLPGVNSAGNQNTTGTSAGLTGTPSITVNAVNGATGTFSGNVTIGGVLTYEDVTNVDSIGVVTARSGVLVGSGITLSPDGDGFFTGVTTATTFVGALTGNVTGNASGSSGSCTGNAATATALETARNIGGVSFDGSSNIDLPGVNSSGNQDTSGNAATATKLAATKTIAGVAFDGSSNISLNNNAITNGAGYITATLTNEQVQDIVGGMVSSNTETGITVTYQDDDGTLDFVVGTLNQDTTGNAATATALETARNIGGVSFDGSANIDLPGVNSAGNQNTSGTAAGLSGTPNISCGTIAGSTGTFTGDVDIADKITHTGNTNTSIRFPDNGTISLETAGSERARITSGGKALFGSTTVRNLGGASAQSQIQLEGTSTNTSSLGLINNQANANSPIFSFGKSRGSSTGAVTTVADGDNLGIIQFVGADGIDLNNNTARIKAIVNGTVAENQIPTDLIFETSASSGSARAERLRITSSGKVVIGHTAANAKLHIASGVDTAVGDLTNPAFQIGATTSYRLGIITTNEQAIIANKNGDDGIAFYTKTGSGGSFGEAIRIESGGQLNIGGDYTQTTYKTQIEATDNNVLRLVNDSDDSNGVELVLYKDSASPADGDGIGGIYFQGNDDGGNSVFYANIEGFASDVSDGTEDGYIRFRTRLNGSIGERVRIDSQGDMGIGTNDPQARLHISSGNSGDCELIIEADEDDNNENDNPRIVFVQDGGIQESSVGMDNNTLVLANAVSSSGGIVFKTGTTTGYTNATERMRILDSGGLTFNGDTSSANALDDYEEGTFTPSYDTSGENMGSITYDVRTGRYTKIGRIVYFTLRLRTDNISDRGTGTIRIKGFPYTHVNVASHRAVTHDLYTAGWTSDDAPSLALFTSNSTYLHLYQKNYNEDSSGLDASAFNTGANDNDVRMTGFYEVA